jgi:hypothetical protein
MAEEIIQYKLRADAVVSINFNVHVRLRDIWQHVDDMPVKNAWNFIEPTVQNVWGFTHSIFEYSPLF